MKVQCDVCAGGEASVFCCADEAALCAACDRKVHGANRLAGKHRRLALSSSSSSSSASHPVCDICQEKRGFVFCQQDRAILCRDCDAPIHAANELTMKHSRFLLTGVRLSSGPIPEAEELTSSSVPKSTDRSSSGTDHDKTEAEAETFVTGDSAKSGENSSSISDYLINMLPGYCVDDLIVDDAFAAAKDAFCKSNGLLPYIESDLDCGVGFRATGEELPIWVPHVPQPLQQPNVFMGSGAGGFSVDNYPHGWGAKEAQQGLGVKMGRERWRDSSLMVPQINNINSISSKRQRTSSAWGF